MPDLSIKNVPAEVLDRLKVQAKKNHRSLQGELMTILEGAAQQKGSSFEALHSRITELGVRTGSESVKFVREDRDAR